MEEKIYPKIQIVDENDNFLDNVGYFEALDMGAIRRAARIFVFNESGQFFVQKRSKNVSKPLLFDQSAAGHVDEGETYHEAAVRELYEELGLEGFELDLIAESYRSPGFYSNIYKLIITDNQPIDFDPHEVDSMHWMEISDIDKLVSESPELCTDSLTAIWPDIKTKLLS